MKRDIETLLKERGFSAALVIKGESSNPTFRYLTGTAGHLIGFLVMRPGATPHLVHGAMERDTAERTGFDRSEFGEYGLRKLMEEEGSAAGGTARLLAAVFERLGIEGRILVQGIDDVGRYHDILRRLSSLRPAIEIAPDLEPGLFLKARLTKDEEEIEAVRSVGSVCARAYETVRGAIRRGRLQNGRLKDGDGWVTIGRLRQAVRGVFFEAGLEEPHGNIVAMGRDAGVPHNAGNDGDVLEAGRPIIVDLYPSQPGGYCFDVTRTFCVGKASEGLHALYADVKAALDRSIDALSPETPARIYQDEVCAFFESRGHRTIRQDERLHEGYVHGLGHGIGLEVHERPSLGGSPANTDRLEPGALFTIEPGLYYPSRDLGVRIEDVVYARPDGSFENLTEIPYELEVEPTAV